MARITIEDCLSNVENRFALVLLTANRVRQIRRGSETLVDCDNKDVVTALREIAAEYVIPRQVTATEESDEDLKIDVQDFAQEI